MTTEESEIRALVDDMATTIFHAKRVGFVQISTVDQRDIILDRSNGELFRSGQKLRIRLEQGRAELTLKGEIRTVNDIAQRSEVTICLIPDQVDGLLTFFNAFGFPVLFQIWKERTTLKREDVTLTVDSWPKIHETL